jgi:hypothetical protein
MAWERETTLKVPMDPTLSNDYLQRVGREIIRTILERTAQGLDKNRTVFPGYSKDYKDSDDFKLTGKSSTVNLRLSGDMLSDLSILDVRKGEIVIGFEDSEQRAKAHGHITGADGTGRLPVRNFLGISDREMASIMRKIPPPIDYEKAKAEGLKRLGKETLTADDIFNIVKESIELRLKKAQIKQEQDLTIQVEAPQ